MLQIGQSFNICVLLCLFLFICSCCFKSCCGNQETWRKTTLTLAKNDAKQIAEHRVRVIYAQALQSSQSIHPCITVTSLSLHVPKPNRLQAFGCLLPQNPVSICQYLPLSTALLNHALADML